MLHGRVALIVAVIASGCGGSTTAPTTITGAALTQYVFSQIQGDVLDTAFRPLAGVRVEIVDGSEAGAFTISDGDGRFSFVGGRYVDGIHFRASKDGYMTTSVSGPLQFPWPSAAASLGIVLDSIAPPARIEPGSYSVTVTADNWWFNVRPSNTEPLLRLNLEASSQEECEARTNEVLAIVREG